MKQRHGRHFAALALLIFSTFGCDEVKKNQAALEIMSQFASSCPSVGSYTQRALDQTNKILEALRAAQTNPKCAGIEKILPEVQSASEELQRLQRSEELSTQITKDQTSRLLALELSTTTDPLLQAQYTYALGQSRIDSIVAQSNYNNETALEKRTNMIRGLSVVSNYLQVLNSANLNLTACFQDSPMLAAQIGATAVAIAGSFLNPALGPALVMAGQSVQFIMELIRREDINASIFTFESSIIDLGLKCSLEAVAENYCETNDMESLLSLYDKAKARRRTKDGFWQALENVTFRLPELTTWIRDISVGVQPANKSATEQPTEAISHYTAMVNLKIRLQGLYSEAERDFKVNPPDQYERLTRNYLDQIARTLIRCSYGGSDHSPSSIDCPVPDIYGGSTSNMLFLLAQGRPIPQGFNGNVDSQSINFDPPGIKFETIKQRADNIINDVAGIVSRRLTQFTILNAPLLLEKGTQPRTFGQWSPISVVNELIRLFKDSERFLSKVNTEDTKIVLREVGIARSQLEYLSQKLSEWIIKDFASTEDRKTSAEELIKDLHGKYLLIFGEAYLNDLIMTVIRQTLTYQLKYDPEGTSVQEVLMGTAQDLMTTYLSLLRTEKRSSIAIRSDLTNAKKLSLDNLDNLMSAFKLGFASSLDRVSKKAKKESWSEDKDHAPPNLTHLGNVCLLILTTQSEWPEEIPLELCKGSMLKSYVPDIVDLQFDEMFKSINDMKKSGIQDVRQAKACTLRNFVRKGALIHSTK